MLKDRKDISRQERGHEGNSPDDVQAAETKQAAVRP